MFLMVFAFRSVHILVRGMLFGVRLFRVELFMMRFVMMLAGARQRFARQKFDGSAVHWRERRDRRGYWRLLVRVPVVVVLQVFEYIANVEEGVAVEADVHESGLHAGEDAGDFSFVDAADQREFFFALDVDFD